MRTVIVTNGNLLSLLNLGEFLIGYRSEIAAVFITTRLPSQKSNIAGVIDMWRKSGCAYTHFKIMTNILLPLIYKLNKIPARIPEFLGYLGSRTPVIKTANINHPAMIERMRFFAPDVLLSSSATCRFSDELIEIPKRIAINAHYALLPAYAGLSPYFWYLRKGESECGVTLHQISARLDAGPVIEQRRFPLTQRTVLQLVLDQAAAISPMLIRYYRGETSESAATPQDLSRRSYFRHPKKADVRALRDAGFDFYSKEDLKRVKQALRELMMRGRTQAV